VALRAGLPLLRPERVADAEVVGELARWKPDLGIVAAFGQFLPKRVRELPALGYLINAHASLLPRHRGAAPIAWAILAGDPVTGISVMRVEREMDAGPVALALETPIGDDESCGELTGRLALLAADAIERAVEQIARDEVRWTPQDPSRATTAPKLERSDARLDFRDTAAALARRVRALSPRPGAYSVLGDEPLRILAARVLDEPVDREPGCVRTAGGALPLRVATAAGWLAPTRVQRAGGVAMEVAAFLRGRPVEDGTRLGEGASGDPDASS